MKITEIQITPIRPRDGLVGFASFVLHNDIFCGSIGIYTRPQGGYRITYPTRKTNGQSVGVFYPINKKVATDIEEAVISQFEKVTKTYARHNSFDIE